MRMAVDLSSLGVCHTRNGVHCRSCRDGIFPSGQSGTSTSANAAPQRAAATNSIFNFIDFSFFWFWLVFYFTTFPPRRKYGIIGA